MLSIFVSMAAALAQANAAKIDVAMVPGAWASADSVEACASAPVSFYFADGTLAVFDRLNGPLHAVGGWRVEGGELLMNYHEVPLAVDAPAKPAMRLAVLELTGQKFVTRTAEGKVRMRVRCPQPPATSGDKAQ